MCMHAQKDNTNKNRIVMSKIETESRLEKALLPFAVCIHFCIYQSVTSF